MWNPVKKVFRRGGKLVQGRMFPREEDFGMFGNRAFYGSDASTIAVVSPVQFQGIAQQTSGQVNGSYQTNGAYQTNVQMNSQVNNRSTNAISSFVHGSHA